MEKNIKLDGERVVSFKVSGQPVTYTFKRVTPEHWKQFFGRIAIESENTNSGRVDVMDFNTAGLAMVDDILIRVQGYKVKTVDGLVDLSTLPEWQQRLPYMHKLKAADLLQDVVVQDSEPSIDGGIILMADVDEVILAASWGSSAEGSMDLYTPLIHRFKPITAKQQQRFSRSTSEAKVIGGSRSGRTVWPVRHALLADLYDELVVSVEGYEFGGKPLDTPAEIVANMDTFHKMCAVQQLFKPATE